jgi:hypothetical protein
LVWVDAFTYIAAERTCGATPLLGVQRSAREGRNGVAFDIVYDQRLRPFPTTVAELARRTLCRIKGDDPLNWVYPSLALRAAGVDPVSDLEAIVEVEDAEALVEAVFDETCEAGAIPAGQLDTLVRRLQSADPPVEINSRETPDVAVLLDGEETWPEVPYPVLIAPTEGVLPTTLRDPLMTALQEIIDDTTRDDALRTLVNYRALVPRTAEDYDNFRQWLNDAKWGMNN